MSDIHWIIDIIVNKIISLYLYVPEKSHISIPAYQFWDSLTLLA